jgi:hypothetical protein
MLVSYRTLVANRRQRQRRTRLLPSPRELLDTPARICEAVETHQARLGQRLRSAASYRLAAVAF